MSIRPLNRVTEEDTCLLYMRIDPYLKYRLQAAAAEVAEMEGIKDVSMSDIVEVCLAMFLPVLVGPRRTRRSRRRRRGGGAARAGQGRGVDWGA